MTENHLPVALDDRTLVTVSGPDAARFLQGVITTDIDHTGSADMFPGALLSPQGKVLFDFLIGCRSGVFYIDIRSAAADDFVRKLSLYRLRADVTIHEENQAFIGVFLRNPDISETINPENDSKILIFKDKRVKREYRPFRIYNIDNRPQGFVNERQKWDMIRIDNGLAESGADFAPGDVFPHDINYDQIKGISFTKGCYIGQEVVSRMQHRGTARRRVLVATGAGPLPPAGAVIEADGKPAGMLGTVIGAKAIALARIDRVSAALHAGSPITAQGAVLTLCPPANVHFSLPVQSAAEGE